EVWRARHFPTSVSRMQGIYFFETRKEAEARIGDNNWPPYFLAENLLEFELLTDLSPTKVDANWITFAKLDPSSGRVPLDDLDWISSYWIGTPDLPLNFHPAAIRASANVTPFGAVSVPA